MMGRVTCLGLMFCGKNKIKNSVIDDAIITERRGEMMSFAALLDKGVTPASQEDGFVASLESSFNHSQKIDSSVTTTNASICAVWGEGETHVCDSHHEFVRSADIDPKMSSKPEFEKVHSGSEKSEDEGRPTAVGVASAGVLEEAEYEGEDEEEDYREGLMLSEYDCGQTFTEMTGKPTISIEFASHTEAHGDQPRRYYDTLDSDRDSGKLFDDLDLADGHVSDPGVYHTKNSESVCSSPLLLHVCHPEAHVSKDDSLSAPSESEASTRPEGDVQGRSGHEIVELSQGSVSSVEVGRDSCLQTLGESYVLDGRESNSDVVAIKGTSPESLAAFLLVSCKRKPWWKRFMARNRNIHKEGDAASGSLVTLATGPGHGYVSDGEAGSSLRSPLLREGNSDAGNCSSTHLGKGGSSALGNEQYDDEGKQLNNDVCVLHESGDGSDESAVLHECSDAPALNGAEVAGTGGNEVGWSFLGEKCGFSRVEQWVMMIDPVIAALDEEIVTKEGSDCPDSPTAPALPFFTTPSKLTTEVLGRDQEDQLGSAGPVDLDLELPQYIVRHINPLLPSAHYPGIGLKILPSLAPFISLRTLNLSANSIVRMVPGCLPRGLHSLDLSRNKIVAVEGLRELSRLRALNLSFNRIARIGNGLSSCMSLRELYLAGNKISEVEGLHRLAKLTVLDLSYNKLTTTKSLSQIAANYKSLLALNLLGNSESVHSNLGEEQLRKFVMGVCPQLIYLNKQALKPVSTRESAHDNVARAAMSGASGSRGNKTSGKASKRAVSSLQQGTPSHQRSHSGGGSISTSKQRLKDNSSPTIHNRSNKSPEGHHRRSHHHSHSRPHDKTNNTKELSRGSPLYITPPSPSSDFKGFDTSGSMHRVRSDGALYKAEWNVSPAT